MDTDRYANENIAYVASVEKDDEINALLDAGFRVIHIGSYYVRAEDGAENRKIVTMAWYGDKKQGVDLFDSIIRKDQDLPPFGKWS